MKARVIQERCGKCLLVEVPSDRQAVEEKAQNTFKSKDLINNRSYDCGVSV
jgi:hypothetical protein